VLDSATAESKHQAVCLGEVSDSRMLAFTKSRFAVAGEDLGDRHPSLGLNYVIHIEELPAKPRGDERANGRLARAHEAGEYDAMGRGCEGFGLNLSGHQGVFAFCMAVLLFPV
jgi:hypothetical protein